MENMLNSLVPYVACAGGIALFLALCQKMIRFVIGMIIGGKIDI